MLEERVGTESKQQKLQGKKDENWDKMAFVG